MKLPAIFLLLAALLSADPIPVKHPQGLLRGFLQLSDTKGNLLASGDLFQTTEPGASKSAPGAITNRLIFHFQDGSTHEETTVFTQNSTFRLLSYRLLQRGPAFQRPTDLRINAGGEVTIIYTEDGKQKTTKKTMKLPADLANGLLPTLLTQLNPAAGRAELSLLVSTPEPRLVKLVLTPAGEDSFSNGPTRHLATRWKIHIDLGGITGIIAPLIGKQPPDTHFWILPGAAPAFLKTTGPLCQECPIWTIQLAAPQWP